MSRVCICLPLPLILIQKSVCFLQQYNSFGLQLVTCLFFFFFSVAPVLHKLETTQYVLQNHSSFLLCPAEGAPAPFIVWRKNGIIVQNSTSVRYKLDIVKENKEKFSCEIKNEDQVTKEELVIYMESEF